MNYSSIKERNSCSCYSTYFLRKTIFSVLLIKNHWPVIVTITCPVDVWQHCADKKKLITKIIISKLTYGETKGNHLSTRKTKKDRPWSESESNETNQIIWACIIQCNRPLSQPLFTFIAMVKSAYQSDKKRIFCTLQNATNPVNEPSI